MRILINVLWLTCAMLVPAASAQADNASPSGTQFSLAKAPKLGSAIALIYDEQQQRPLFAKGADNVAPIASITKLMTAMVLLDAKLPMDEKITLTAQDEDHYKLSRSRLRRGMTLTRGDMLKLALMASENRAAAALARTFPGGVPAMVKAMNDKAQALGMEDTNFVDATGLHSDNVSTAYDLVKMVLAAQGYDQIREATTTGFHVVDVGGRKPMRFGNTNPLVRSASWDISLSKTGYISEAGRCLVMKTRISERPVVVVLLDSWGRHTRVGDANRIRHWMESSAPHTGNSRRG